MLLKLNESEFHTRCQAWMKVVDGALYAYQRFHNNGKQIWRKAVFRKYLLILGLPAKLPQKVSLDVNYYSLQIGVKRASFSFKCSFA